MSQYIMTLSGPKRTKGVQLLGPFDMFTNNPLALIVGLAAGVMLAGFKRSKRRR